MAAPQPVIPGRFYMVTRRCTQRQFLLRPSPTVNNAFLYCLALAAQRSCVDVVLPSVLSNHHHTNIFDRHGRHPEFTEHLHKLTAKCFNVHRGRDENFWSSAPCCTTHLVEPDDVLHEVTYAAANPVRHHLVDRVDHWPGLNGLSALLNDRILIARRPSFFFDPEGDLPETVTLKLVIPEELGIPPDEFRRLLRDQVRIAEDNAATERRNTGRRVIGRRNILAQDWRSSPTTDTPHNTLRPRFACRNEVTRLDTIDRLRDFRRAYREARLRLPDVPVPFPYGTYALRRFSNVPVGPPPT